MSVVRSFRHRLSPRAALAATVALVCGGLASVTVPIAGADPVVVDADAAANGQDISTFFPGVTLNAVGSANPGVFALDNTFSAPTAPRVFAWNTGTSLNDFWIAPGSPDLRATFAQGYESVSIDYVADGTLTMTAFDALNQQVNQASITTSQSGTLSVSGSGDVIRSVLVAYTKRTGSDAAYLDHLVLTPAVPEPASAALAAAGGVALLGRRRRRHVVA